MDDLSYRTKIYIVLICLFSSCLIIGNIIFKKFTYFSLYSLNFELSVGGLTYPLTFVFTDLISEFYGKQKSDFAIKCGVISSIFIAFIVTIANKLPATSWSYVSVQEFDKMFGLYGAMFISSVFSNYIAQTVDIRIYLFFKDLTKGKFIWLRNNVSTITSQIVDSLIIYSCMIYFGAIPMDKFTQVFGSAILFKVLFTLSITPLYYILILLIRRLLQKKLKKHVD